MDKIIVEGEADLFGSINIPGSKLILDLKDVKFVKRGSNTHLELGYLQEISNQLVMNQ